MFVEASSPENDGQSFGRLLANIADEYHEFRKADLAMQMHRANWMAQIERVMRQQEELKACFESLRNGPRIAKISGEELASNPNSLASGAIAIGDSYDEGRLPADLLMAPPPPAPWKAQTLPPLPSMDGATSGRGSSTMAPSSIGNTPKDSPRGSSAIGPQVNIDRLCAMSTKPQVSEVALQGLAPSKPSPKSGLRLLDLAGDAPPMPMPYPEGLRSGGPGNGFPKTTNSVEDKKDNGEAPDISFSCLTPRRPQPLTSWPDWGKKLEVEEVNAACELMQNGMPPDTTASKSSPRLQASVRIQVTSNASAEAPVKAVKDQERWSAADTTQSDLSRRSKEVVWANKRSSGSDSRDRDAPRESKVFRPRTGSAEPPTYEFSDSLVPQPTLNDTLLYQQENGNGHAEDIMAFQEAMADVSAVVLVDPHGTSLPLHEETSTAERDKQSEIEKEGSEDFVEGGERESEHEEGEDDSNDQSLARRELLVAGNGSWSGMKRLSARQSSTPSMEEKPHYDVYDPYHTSGISQKIARSDIFANVTLGIISLNAIYIGVEADKNQAESLNDADPFFQVSENMFCFYFTFEWLVRFLAFKFKRNCCRDTWFKFDSALVILMIVETWITPAFLGGSPGTGLPTGMVKLLRLLRLARMARLMRAFPELVAMIKGLQEASRAVGSALMMVLLLIYIFAIIMRMLMEKTYSLDPLLEERFATLPICMWTLFMDGTLLDGVSITTRALYKYQCYGAFLVLWLFVLMSAMTVMNMLIGVLCEVVTAVAAAEKEEAAIRLVKETVLVMLKKLDEDGSGEISKEEMNMVFDDEAALQVLASLQVDMTHLVDYLDMYFEQQSELSIYQIMDLILMLRGDRVPTMKDMLDREAFARWKFSASLDMLENRMRPALYRS